MAHSRPLTALAALLFTACGSGEAPGVSATGFAQMEALGLHEITTHTDQQGTVLTRQSTASFDGSLEAMVAACRDDLRADGITSPTEAESGSPDHRIVDLNGSSDHSQRICRVEGPRTGTGGTVSLVDAREATGTTPRAGGGFACGPHRCTESELCVHVYGQGQPGPALPDEYACRPGAAACAGVARCACLDERRSCHEVDGYPFVDVPRP